MIDNTTFYIDGAWTAPQGTATLDVINPATEQPIGRIALGTPSDVDRAVSAARVAFETYAFSTREARLALLDRVIEVYQSRLEEMAQRISAEMGAPLSLARKSQAPAGLGHLKVARQVLADFAFAEDRGRTQLVK